MPSLDDTPALVIKTVELVQCSFDKATEAMAMAEGEDDNLEGEREGHRRYFERNWGLTWDMMIVRERLIVVEDLS